MTKVLYLEDEQFLASIVKESLASRCYNIRLVNDGAHVINAFKNFKPDICVLDVMVPNIDGLSLATEIRKIDANIPILFLTAKSQAEDVLAGFKVGGNDYVKKPFSMEELIVRMENLLSLTSSQKQQSDQQENISIGKFTFEYKKYLLSIGDKKIELSNRENQLIKLFGENQNQKVDRQKILKQIWGDDSLYNSRNLDVYIRKLRIYFQADPNIKLITLRGIGYHLSVDSTDS